MDEPMSDAHSDAPSELTDIDDVDLVDRVKGLASTFPELSGLLSKAKASLSDERRKVWNENMEEIANLPEPCQIAIVGQTGCGKSSLLNAMLDASVAPTSSSGRACTSVPTEFSFKDIQHYEAIITFREEEEWKEEVLALQADFSQSLDGSQEDRKFLMEVDARWKAVCPHVTEQSIRSLDVDQILSQGGFKDVLGQTEYLSSPDPSELQKMLYHRMAGNRTDTTGDPTVETKKIQVFGKFPALSTGVTLVDVPGSGDANSVRLEPLYTLDNMSRKVVEQKRAIDNLDALEKLKTLIKRLFSDGRLADCSLSLVFTMADMPVDFHEVDQYMPYGDENVIRGLHEQVTTVDRYKAEKQNLEKKLRSMKTTRSKAALALKKQIEGIDVRLDALGPQYINQSKQLKSLLAKIRSKRVVIGFEHILGEICGALSIDVTVPLPLLGVGFANLPQRLPRLPIFCVATHDYLELQRFGEPLIFAQEQETQIPDLREHIVTYGTTRNVRHITRVLTDTNELFDQARQHFDDDSRQPCDLGPYEKKAKITLKKQSEDNRRIVRGRMSEIEQLLGEFVNSHLKPQVIDARDRCGQVFNDTAKANHWRAYAACMRRQGEHGTIDLNRDLIKHVYPNITPEWFQVFTVRIPAIFTQLEEDLLGAIVEAMKELGQCPVTSSYLSGLLDSSLEKDVPPHRQESIERALSSVSVKEKMVSRAIKVRKDVSLRQRDISHSFKSRIKETLKPHYKTVGKESGPGMYQRMKSANEQYVRESCGHLFECFVHGVASDLRGKLCDDVQVKLEKNLGRILDDIRLAYLGALNAPLFLTEKKEREHIMRWVRAQQRVLVQIMGDVRQAT
ncbi:hypothetical protein JAAARDRAFT_188822 [Jaapia argillacea MUCL 33604]|uniref:G domain-containing protein n=1 Tax=Jaapia argillacea MUCL 33604 TaxID=933084 RepID=A0A067QI73_9AGAM|nr:hypothetical protein JAAARDRAFT_188822 [Jaapia argillacea MUCL 33604]